MHFLVNWVARFGMPAIVMIDRDTIIHRCRVDLYLHAVEMIQHVLATAYHP